MVKVAESWLYRNSETTKGNRQLKIVGLLPPPLSHLNSQRIFLKAASTENIRQTHVNTQSFTFFKCHTVGIIWDDMDLSHSVSQNLFQAHYSSQCLAQVLTPIKHFAIANISLFSFGFYLIYIQIHTYKCLIFSSKNNNLASLACICTQAMLFHPSIHWLELFILAVSQWG